jgi:hypothetical protein
VLPLLLWSCSQAPPEPGSAETLTILFSSRGEGEIEPCG